MALSPEGGFAAVGTADGRVLVFRTGAWEPVAGIRPHDGTVTRVILGPDAEVCVSASLGRPGSAVDHRVEQWWPLRDTRMRGLHIPADEMDGDGQKVALAPDGSTVLRIGYLLDDAPLLQLGDELAHCLLGHAKLLGQLRAAHALGVQMREQRRVSGSQRRTGRTFIHARDGSFVDESRGLVLVGLIKSFAELGDRGRNRVPTRCTLHDRRHPTIVHLFECPA